LAGVPIVTVVASDSPLWISAAVSELLVGRVRVGQPVVIRIDAFRNRTFRGKVTQIGGATEFSTGETARWQLQQVPIKVSLDTEGVAVIPGMTCRVWIDVRSGS
jgi:multidrug resistance efflux pump